MPAVTLALWGGLLADDPGRRDREQTWRQAAVLEHLTNRGVDASTAAAVWADAVRTFRAGWLEEQTTVGIARALGEGLAAHGLRPAVAFDVLVAELETRALDDLPQPLPGARDALRALAARWPVGVICDVRVTPAPVLREVLELLELAEFIDVAVFSDEVGACRPARRPFRVAALELGINLEELVHVGPSEARDVLGAQAAGASAVRLGEPPTAAEGVCDNLRNVARVVGEVVSSW